MSETVTRSLALPDAGELPLSFNAWAELSARLLNLGAEQRLELLYEHKVKPDAWRRCDQHYLLLLSREIAQGRTDLVEEYSRASSAEIERRKKADVPQVPEATAEAAQADSAPSTVSAQDGPPVPGTAVPSFLQPRDLGAPVVAAAMSPPIARPPAHLAGTAMAFELPTALRPKPADALPFQAGASPLIAAIAPGSTLPLAPAPTAGATLGIGVDLMAQARATLPFAKSGGAARVVYPRMPMQTYASFVAERAMFPEKAAEILQKYNVSSGAALAALEQEWRTRLEAHADTKVEWEAMVATYRAWLLQQPR